MGLKTSAPSFTVLQELATLYLAHIFLELVF